MKTKPLILAFFIGFFLSVTFITNATGQTTQDNSSANTEQKKRIEQRKQRLKIKLSNAENTRLQNRCKGAQTKLATLQEVAKKHSEQNDQKILKLIDRISGIIEKQNKDNQDLSKIETALEAVNTQGRAVDAAYQQYSLALADAAKIDCKSDALGFKSSLQDARDEFKQLKEARKKLRTVLKENLKPALAEFRKTKNQQQ